ncbi:MAG: ABC transporter permease [Petrotogales bacterium]
MKYAFYIAVKDLIYFFRSRFALIAFIIMPVFMMLMTGYIFPKMQSNRDMNIAVLSHDDGFERMMSDNEIKSFTFVESEEELHTFLIDEKADAGMVVPQNFLGSVLTNKEVTVRIIPSPSNPQMAMSVSQGVMSILGNSLGGSQAKLDMKIENPSGGEFSYYSFMAPGIMAMVAVMSVVNGLAAAITMEKEKGTMDGIMTTPIPRFSIVLGKVLSQTARGLLQAVVILLLAIFLFGVTIQGSLLLTFFLLILGIFSFIGIGIIITAGAPDQESSQMILTSITFPMLFLSGVFFPVEQMPKFMQYLSKAFPLTFAADALRKVMIMGASLSSIRIDIIALTIFAVVTLSIAVPLFSRLTTT